MKEKDNLRKIDVDAQHPIRPKHILNFITNSYVIDGYFDFLTPLMELRLPDTDKAHEIFADSSILAAIYNKIDALYRDAAPYPWYKFKVHEADAENNIEEDPTDKYNVSIVNKIVFLFVYQSYHYTQKTAVSFPCSLFKPDGQNHFVINNSGSHRLGEYLYSCKLFGVRNIYLLQNAIHNYQDILSCIRPDYDFWHEKYEDIKLKYNCLIQNPYDLSFENIITGILTKDDMLIIDTPIPSDMAAFFASLSCKIIYLTNDSAVCKNTDMMLITAEAFIDNIIPFITKDPYEIQLLLNLSSKIRFQTDLYELLDKYYKKYEKESPGKGISFLKSLANAEHLSDTEKTLALYDHTKVTSSLVGKKTGVYLRNAILNIYKYHLYPEERQTLRILCRLREINSSLSCKRICDAFHFNDVYEKLLAWKWIDSTHYQIPEFIVASVTYKPNFSNAEFDFYLNCITDFSLMLLGYCNTAIDLELFISMIQYIHSENKQYLSDKSKQSRKLLSKIYYRQFEKLTELPPDYFSSPLSLFRSSGRMAGNPNLNEENPYTDSIFQYMNVSKFFYCSSLIFCLEYEQDELAKLLFEDVFDKGIPLLSNKKEIEFCSMRKLWKELLYSSPKNFKVFYEIITDIAEKDKYLATLKPVLLVFLRYSILTVSKFLCSCTVSINNDNHIREFYKKLLIEINLFLSVFRKLGIDIQKLWKTEYTVICQYSQLVLYLYEQPFDIAEVSTSNTFYRIHWQICQKILNADSNIASLQGIGDLPPHIKDFFS